MSKKSSRRNASGTDTDGQTINSERNKFYAPFQVLQLSPEDISRESSGDHSYTSNVLETNITESLKRDSSSTSFSSLDKNLYGTSDVFNDNLAFLKHKLCLMKIIDSQEETHLTPKFHTVTQRACSKYEIDVLQPTVSTIYETSEATDTDNTVSSTSYRVPKKKVCVSSGTNTPRIHRPTSQISFTPSPKSLDLSMKNSTSEELSSGLSPVSTTCEQPTLSINQCTNNCCDKSIAFSKDSSSLFLKSTCIQCDVDNRVPEATGQQTADSLGINLDFCLNLSSNVSENCISTSKLTPLQPNVIIVGPIVSDSKKTKRVVKISPCKIRGKSNTNHYINRAISPNITDTKDVPKQHVQTTTKEIKEKYCEDTPEFSSFVSTPTYIVSSIDSNNCSNESTPKYTANKKLQKVSPKTFHPYLNYGLDVPRLSTHLYSFPAISKITSFVGHYIENIDHTAGDNFPQIDTPMAHRTDLFSLISTVSIPSYKKTCTVDNVHGSYQTMNKGRVLNERKEHGLNVPFYSYSTESSTDSPTNNPTSFRGNSPTSDEESSQECCCFSFFPTKLKQLFLV